MMTCRAGNSSFFCDLDAQAPGNTISRDFFIQQWRPAIWPESFCHAEGGYLRRICIGSAKVTFSLNMLDSDRRFLLLMGEIPGRRQDVATDKKTDKTGKDQRRD
jgi:hypothetical protein